MVNHLGCILRFTNMSGRQFYSIIVDFHKPSKLYGIRADDGTSDTTLWIGIDEAPLGAMFEILPADTPVTWHNETLRCLIRKGVIARLIKESRQRLLAEEAERESMYGSCAANEQTRQQSGS